MATVDDCGIMPAKFMELLASTLMVASDGTVFINYITVVPTECDCDPYINCTNNHLSLDEILRNAFKVDACGHLALVIGNCDGTTRDQ
jgi:hypothetical protein